MSKGQIWSIDLIIAVTIFLTGIIFFYVYTLNYGNDADTTLVEMQYDAEHIADIVRSAGYPKNWSPGEVNIPGIIDEGHINESKLSKLALLTEQDYQRTKALFATSYNWFINFSEPMIIGNVTYASIGQTSTNPTELFRVQRITIYRNKPVIMNIYIWK